MAMVQYHPHTPTHISRTPTSSSRNSHPSSYTHRSSTATPSRPSSSRHNSASSASSTGSSYSYTSTRTFGTSSRPGYAPGQAPHDYFYNESVREEWDSAPVDGSGRRVRQTRIRGRGSEWPAQNAYASPILRVDEGQSERGSRHLRYGGFEDETWDNDTVSPADSISQVSSQHPSRFSSRRSGMNGMEPSREQYPQSAYSRRPSVMDAGFEGMHMGSGGSRMGSGMLSRANGLLVRIEEPDGY
jgi:hypothetical protein